MKTIVRIQHHSDDCGLWRAGGWSAIIDQANCHESLRARHEKFPTPYKEGIDFTIEHFCAFKSIDQLQEWVLPEEMKEIISLGFKVLLLDVSECLEGEYQIAFKKEHIVQSKDITEIFKA